jgi:hypothetical protein
MEDLVKLRGWMLLAIVVCLVPAVALAHPGHGDGEPSSWRHYLTEPIHVLVVVAAVAAIAGGWRVHRRRRLVDGVRSPRDR